MGLAVSVLIGIYYLIFNDHLWLTAQSHAYALIGFVIADCVFLALLVGNRTKIGFVGALAIASIQGGTMFVDLYSYQDIPFFQVNGSNFEDMMEHTYGTWSFDLLLATQVWIIAMGIIGLKRTGDGKKPTKRQGMAVPAALAGVAILLAVFPLSPIYEKQEWTYVHGVGWQAPETFRNADIQLADQFLHVNGTMILRQTHPLRVEGMITMKGPCTEDAKPLVTIYAGARINLHVLDMEYVAGRSDPPIYCSYVGRFPQSDYIVNFIGMENTSGEPIFFSPEHTVNIKLTKIEGDLPVHPNFSQ